MISEASSWALIQALSMANAKDYIDKRAALGFNALKVSVINQDYDVSGDYGHAAPAWNGVNPFLTSDFSSPNPAYFDHAAEVVSYMRSKGMLVFLFTNYLGYAGSGWRARMVADTNAHCYSYGQFLGNRFKDFPNLIWAAGGDHYPDSTEEARQAAIIDGIRSVDPGHYWTAHWDNGDARGGSLTTDETAITARMGTVINGLYSFNPANPPHMYSRVRESYNANYSAIAGKATIPVMVLDEPYETEPQGSPLEIRSKSHRAMCEGAAGIGFCTTGWWTFTNWTTVTRGATEASYAKAFWASVPWQAMTPDTSNAYVTSGRGTFNTANYVTAIANSTYLVAYLPSGVTSIGVDMSKFSKAMRSRWWDPTANAYRLDSSSLNNSGSKTFTTPGNNSAGEGDWLLALD